MKNSNIENMIEGLTEFENEIEKLKIKSEELKQEIVTTAIEETNKFKTKTIENAKKQNAENLKAANQINKKKAEEILNKSTKEIQQLKKTIESKMESAEKIVIKTILGVE
jgi:vacuolar-type H+-ATPase subunit H|tara:strand:+ start:422 stop:751 length:330 start_codon:yes stop_codon:yes gene_type:complete